MAALQSVTEKSATESDASQRETDYESFSDTKVDMREENHFVNNTNMVQKIYGENDCENNYRAKVDMYKRNDYADKIVGEHKYVYRNSMAESIIREHNSVDKVCTENNEDNNSTKGDTCEDYEYTDIIRRESIHENGKDTKKEPSEDCDYDENSTQEELSVDYDYIDKEKEKRLLGDCDYINKDTKEELTEYFDYINKDTNEELSEEYDYIEKDRTGELSEDYDYVGKDTKEELSEDYDYVGKDAKEELSEDYDYVGKDTKEELSEDYDYVGKDTKEELSEDYYSVVKDTKKELLGDNDYIEKVCEESRFVNNNDMRNAILGGYDCVDNICGESGYDNCSSAKDNTCGINSIGVKLEKYKSVGSIEKSVLPEESTDERVTCATVRIDTTLDITGTITENENKSCKINCQFKNSGEGVKPVEIGSRLQINVTEKMFANRDPICDETTKNINVSRAVFADSEENSKHSDMFIVQMVECPPQDSIQTGTFFLDITQNGLSLLDIDTKTQRVFWPLNGIRRFGLHRGRGRFLFEAGRGCEKGPGVYAFQSDNPEMIYEETLKTSKGKNE